MLLTFALQQSLTPGHQLIIFKTKAWGWQFFLYKKKLLFFFSEQQKDFCCSQAMAINWDGFYCFRKSHTLKGSSRGHLVNPCSGKQGCKCMPLTALGHSVLDTSKTRNSTTSLSNLVQCLITLKFKSFFFLHGFGMSHAEICVQSLSILPLRTMKNLALVNSTLPTAIRFPLCLLF